MCDAGARERRRQALPLGQRHADWADARGTERFNFVYSAENGRVYKAGSLSVPNQQMGSFQIERKGNGADYPTLVISAATATYKPGNSWTLHKGTVHVVPTDGPDFAVAFDSLRDRGMTEQPSDLLATPRSALMRTKAADVRSDERNDRATPPARAGWTPVKSPT